MSKQNLEPETPAGRWVALKSLRGHTFRVWRPYQVMPFIEQHFLDCSIYLYASRQSAEAGENFGGSGCLVSVLSPPIERVAEFGRRNNRFEYVWRSAYPPHLYAVTNKHVARKGFPVIRLNTIDGEKDVLELDHNDWIPHPDGDDLAVAPIDLPPDKHNYFPIDSLSFVKLKNLFDLESNRYEIAIGAGDDTFMVGRFISHAGKQYNTPSLRFGSIAMLPFEKVKLGSEADGYMQDAFLVETRSISGFSGSPVFVYQPQANSFVTEEGWQESIINLVGEPRLLGIDCGHVPKYEKVVDGGGNPHPHGWKIPANTGMSIVIPAWRLDALLNIERLVMQREEKNKRHQEEKELEETVVLDVEKKPDEFTRESYQDALRRASSRASEPESEPKSGKDD